MTTCLGKSCLFGLLRVSNYVFSYFPFGFKGRMWDLIVSVPDHCLSFYFKILQTSTFYISYYICYLLYITYITFECHDINIYDCLNMWMNGYQFKVWSHT